MSRKLLQHDPRQDASMDGARYPSSLSAKRAVPAKRKENKTSRSGGRAVFE